MEDTNTYSRDIGEGVRQFIATSASEALKQVRAELGPDALIMSQAQVGDRVIMEAALELPELSEVVEAINPDPQTSNVEHEIAIRDHPIESEVSKSLQDEDAYEYEPQCEVPRAGLDIDVLGKPISSLRGYYRFIGGSGVGKTSLLIKTAVDYVIANGTHGLVVLSTDHERLAGSEQLALSCQMLGIQLVTRDPANLASAVEMYRGKDLVLIDTTAAEIIQPMPIMSVSDVFVCSAEHSMQSLNAQRRLCAHARYAAITHLDRPGDYQNIGKWLSETGQELLAIGTSGYLPEGLEMACDETVQRYFCAGDSLEKPISVSV